jgi:ribosomal protein S6--L-glutamate ligase
MGDPLRIGLLVEDRYLSQSQPSGMRAALEARGQQVTLINPQTGSHVMGDYGWLDGHEMIVGRGRSYGLLCLMWWAESRGLLTINRKAAIAAVHNKADMAVSLAASRIPTPRTFLGNTRSLASEVGRENYPLILKPIFGDNCRGLLVVNTPEEMAEAEWEEPVALAQSYMKSDGYDLKLYGIGDEVWAVRKPSPFNKRASDDDGSKSGLVELTPELEDLGRRCGKTFGLDLYGVDCIQTDGGVLVIEINDFPNYTSVPEADERLADYVISRGEEERSK